MNFYSALQNLSYGFCSGFSFGVRNFVAQAFMGMTVPFWGCSTPFFGCSIPFWGNNNISLFNFGLYNTNTLDVPDYTNLQNSIFNSYNNSPVYNYSNVDLFNNNSYDFNSRLSYTDDSYLSTDKPDFKPIHIAPLTQTPRSKKSSSKARAGSSGNGNKVDYRELTRDQALAKAQADPNLEELTGGEGWKVADIQRSFPNDIPYARKGTGALLTKAFKMAGLTKNLVVTSALGTAGSPHSKEIDINGASHYNPVNPKLDLGGGLSEDEAKDLASRLMATGLFNRVVAEDNKSKDRTWHIDLQFKESAYATV